MISRSPQVNRWSEVLARSHDSSKHKNRQLEESNFSALCLVILAMILNANPIVRSPRLDKFNNMHHVRIDLQKLRIQVWFAKENHSGRNFRGKSAPDSIESRDNWQTFTRQFKGSVQLLRNFNVNLSHFITRHSVDAPSFLAVLSIVHFGNWMGNALWICKDNNCWKLVSKMFFGKSELWICHPLVRENLQND